MKYTDFEKFFEHHIEKFLPFRDQITYQELVKFLKNIYFKDSYKIIPENFKSLLEEQTIPAEMYSVILLSLGFSEDIVNNCLSIQKEMLLQNFGDYNRYKGSRHVLSTILANFEQRINIYELFVDYRDSDWCFLPSLIHNNTQVTAYNEILNYNTIANQAKYFLITKPQLTSLKSAEKIVLPIKSNILYIQAEMNLYIGYVENIVFTTVFHNYYDDLLLYYNNDDIFSISLLGMFQLWEYLIMRKTGNTGFPEISKTNLIFLDPGSDNDPTTTPYSLISTDSNYIDDTLITAFDNISTIRERDAFFDAYIKSTPSDPNKFYRVDYTANELTLVDIEGMFQSPTSPVGFDIFEYIDNRLNTAVSMSYEIDLILEELRSSFLIWIDGSNDTVLTKYYTYLLRYLDATHPIIITETSIITKLINFLKPQHTEIVTNNMSYTRVFDKFNALLLDDSFSTYGKGIFRDSYVITDDYYCIIVYHASDPYIITDDYDTSVTVIRDDPYVITDSFTTADIYAEYVSALSLSDDFYNSSSHEFIDSYVVSDDYDHCVIIYHDSDSYIITDNAITQHAAEYVSALSLSDDFYNSSSHEFIDSYVIADDYDISVTVIQDDPYVITDITTIQHSDESISAFSISDDFILSKTYDGSFSFAASNIIQADAVGYAEFDVDDYIFSLSDTSDCALKITNKDLPTLQLTLENTYTGSTGVVAKAWKIC